MRRVLDGGEGSTRGGRVERSRESVSLALLEVGLDDDDGDVGGEASCAAMIAERVSREKHRKRTGT